MATIGFWKAIKNMFREKKETAAKALADPIRDERFDIEDKKREIADFTRQLAALVAELKKLEEDIRLARAERAKFDQWAKQAADKVKAQDTEKNWNKLLQQAAAQVARFDKQIAEKQERLATQTVTQTKLQKALDTARNQIAMREQTLASNAARLKSAQITTKLNAAAAGLVSDDGSPDLLSDQVRQAEAEAAAVVDLAATPDSELESAFSDVDASANDLASQYLSDAK